MGSSPCVHTQQASVIVLYSATRKSRLIVKGSGLNNWSYLPKLRKRAQSFDLYSGQLREGRKLLSLYRNLQAGSSGK